MLSLWYLIDTYNGYIIDVIELLEDKRLLLPGIQNQR